MIWPQGAIRNVESPLAQSLGILVLLLHCVRRREDPETPGDNRMVWSPVKDLAAEGFALVGGRLSGVGRSG